MEAEVDSPVNEAVRLDDCSRSRLREGVIFEGAVIGTGLLNRLWEVC